MRYSRCIILVFFFIAIKGFPQPALLSTNLVVKLDSIRTNKECHFGELYFTSTLAANNYILSLPESMQQFSPVFFPRN